MSRIWFIGKPSFRVKPKHYATKYVNTEVTFAFCLVNFLSFQSGGASWNAYLWKCMPAICLRGRVIRTWMGFLGLSFPLILFYYARHFLCLSQVYCRRIILTMEPGKNTNIISNLVSLKLIVVFRFESRIILSNRHLSLIIGTKSIKTKFQVN